MHDEICICYYIHCSPVIDVIPIAPAWNRYSTQHLFVHREHRGYFKGCLPRDSQTTIIKGTDHRIQGLRRCFGMMYSSRQNQRPAYGDHCSLVQVVEQLHFQCSLRDLQNVLREDYWKLSKSSANCSPARRWARRRVPVKEIKLKSLMRSHKRYGKVGKSGVSTLEAWLNKRRRSTSRLRIAYGLGGECMEVNVGGFLPCKLWSVKHRLFIMFYVHYIIERTIIIRDTMVQNLADIYVWNRRV
jgi:hypothetical protein